MRLGLVCASVCHFILSAFESWDFNIMSVFVVLFMAESKLRLQWQYELVPPVYPSVSLFAAPVYIMNVFVWDWSHTWKYTDKVWKSMDILYPVANVAGGFVLRHIYGLDGVE